MNIDDGRDLGNCGERSDRVQGASRSWYAPYRLGMLGGRVARGACTCGDLFLEEFAAALEVSDNTEFLGAFICDLTARAVFEL